MEITACASLYTAEKKRVVLRFAKMAENIRLTYVLLSTSVSP